MAEMAADSAQLTNPYALVFKTAAEAARVAQARNFPEMRVLAHDFESAVTELSSRRSEMAAAILGFGWRSDVFFEACFTDMEAAADGVRRLQAFARLLHWLRIAHTEGEMTPVEYPDVPYGFLMALAYIAVQAACCRDQEEWRKIVLCLQGDAIRLKAQATELAVALEAGGVSDQVVAELKRSIGGIRRGLPFTQLKALERLFSALAEANFGKCQA